MPHQELLFKLWRIGITGPLWYGLKAYLLDRKHFVSIDFSYSSLLPALSGVPQQSLSDNHLAESCPENPARLSVQWQMGVGWPTPVQASPRGTQKPKSGFMKIYYLFNKKEGSGCAFSPCKFAHVCLGCRGDHPRSACPLGSGLARPGSAARNGMKHPRNDQNWKLTTLV